MTCSIAVMKSATDTGLWRGIEPLSYGSIAKKQGNGLQDRDWDGRIPCYLH